MIAGALRVALLGLALGACNAHAQPIYKWVDAQGRTHYGEKPLDGTPATPIAAPTPPSDPTRANTPGKWKEMERDLRTKRLDKEREADAKAKDRTSPERQKDCAEARRQITILEREVPVFSRDSKGERVYASDEVRAKELQNWKRIYEENCN